MRSAEWYARHEWSVTPHEETQLLRLIAAVAALRVARPNDLARLLRRYPRVNGQFSKDQLVAAYHHFCEMGQLRFDPEVLRRLQMKPTRTVSGVATVTVLTKPFPCPGECNFCPTDVRMPKSYLHDEPGAIRAEYHGFDPYLTTLSRLRALRNIGHATDKIELLILGGTWSYYPADYQAWFVRRCLDAMNEQVVATVDAARSLEAAADALRPDITLASAVRWIPRRLTPVRVTLITIVTLCPAAFVGDARLAAVRTALATASALVALRAHVADHLAALPTPLGFQPRRPRRDDVTRAAPHGMGADRAGPGG